MKKLAVSKFRHNVAYM